MPIKFWKSWKIKCCTSKADNLQQNCMKDRFKSSVKATGNIIRLTKKQKPIEKLHDNLYIVYKAYFNAGKRFQSLKLWSEVCLAALSFFLIMFSLCNAYDLDLGFASKTTDFISVVSAIFMLVYSILVGSRNYGIRSIKMHQCGLELNKLYRKISLIVSLPEGCTNDKYIEVEKQYSDILDKYDNYEEVDYLHGIIRKWPEKVNWRIKLQYYYCSKKAFLVYLIGPLVAILFFLVSLLK